MRLPRAAAGHSHQQTAVWLYGVFVVLALAPLALMLGVEVTGWGRLWDGFLHALAGYEACAVATFSPPLALGAALTTFVLGFPAALAAVAAAREWWRTETFVRSCRRRAVPAPAVVRKLAGHLGLEGRYTVFFTVRPQAFTAGFWRPHVYLSTAVVERLSEAELAALLRHEQHHLMQRDPAKMWIASALREGLFFLPTLGELLSAYRVAQELAADEWAISHQGDSLPLASALVKVVREEDRWRHAELAAALQAPFASSLEVRIACLLGRASPLGPLPIGVRSFVLSTLSLLVVFSLVFGFCG